MPEIPEPADGHVLDIADTRADPAWPGWFGPCAWTALLALCLAPLFPRLQAPINLGGGLGVLCLAYAVFLRKQTIIPNIRLRRAFIAYAIACLASILLPNLAYWPDTGPLSDSLHEFWNAVCAATAAGLILLLTRDRKNMAALLFLVTLTLLVIMIGVPMEQFLANRLSKRISGTKGGANRYAILMFVSSFWFLMWHFAAKARTFRPAAWATAVAGVLLVAAPYLLFRKSFDHWSTRFFRLFNNVPVSAVILALSMLLGGVLYWLGNRRNALSQRLVTAAGLALVLFNIAIGMSRMVLALALLLGIIVFFLKIRHRALIALALIALAAGVFLSIRHNHRFQSQKILESFAIRKAIRTEAWDIFRQYPVLGAGYGRESFRAHWTFPSPPPLNSMPKHQNRRYTHAHNLWAHLLATQGVVGWICFHFLWASAGLALLRAVRNPAGLSADAEERSALRDIACFSLVGLLLLQVNGILMYPLQECNQIMYWAVAALGVSAARTPGAESTPGA